MEELVRATELAKRYNLELKVVVAVKSFDFYNSFYNIFGENEEPCRRILILTKDKSLEEVYDDNPDKSIDEPFKVGEDIWLKDYPLTVNPSKLNFKDIYVKNIEF